MNPVCYVCFDGDNDIYYYRLMQAWNENPKFNFNFNNAHDITQARDSSTEESIKRSLRTRLKASDILIVLVGESTKYLYKYVRWEIEVAIELELAIIVVNLDKYRRVNYERCPPILKQISAIHIPYGAVIIDYAIKYWPTIHKSFEGPRIYSEEVYKSLGL